MVNEWFKWTSDNTKSSDSWPIVADITDIEWSYMFFDSPFNSINFEINSLFERPSWKWMSLRSHWSSYAMYFILQRYSGFTCPLRMQIIFTSERGLRQFEGGHNFSTVDKIIRKIRQGAKWGASKMFLTYCWQKCFYYQFIVWLLPIVVRPMILNTPATDNSPGELRICKKNMR